MTDTSALRALRARAEAAERQAEILSDTIIPAAPEADSDGILTSRAAYEAWLSMRARAEAAEANAIINSREENGRFSAGSLAARIALDGATMRVAVNAMTPILRSDMDASAWPSVSQTRDALIAALRAIEAEDAEK